MEKWGVALAKEKESYLKNYMDCLNGRTDYKYAEKDKLLEEHMERTNAQLEEITDKCGRMRVKISSLNTMIRSLTRCTVIGLSFLLSMYAGLSVGTMVAIISVLSLIEDECASAQVVLQTLSETKSVRDRIYETIDFKSQQNDPQENEKSEWTCFGLKNVCLAYNTRQILQKTSVSFLRGRKYLIMGKSGCGKSTLIKTMLGICRGQEGSIFIDEKDFPLGSENILELSSYMDQNFYLFQDSIENNIFFEREDYRENLRLTRFDRILNRYVPDLKQKLRENGSNLSGGQRQIIGIARMLARNKRILIFDESFSALDEQLFIELTDFLQQLKDVTLIVISHRRQNLRGYDMVYEMIEGNLYEKRMD